MFHATSTDGVKWVGGGPAIGGDTSHGPALAVLGNRLHRVWKHAGDTSMRISGNSAGTETGWSTPQSLTDGNASDGPALAAGPGNKLYRLWKSPENAMFINSSLNGAEWLAGAGIKIKGLTSHNPALAAGPHGRLYRVWKGKPGDDRMHISSSLNELDWSPEEPIPIGLTSHGPALAVGPGNKLYRLWKARNSNSIMISISDSIEPNGKVVWGPEFPILGGTDNTPALVNF